MWSGCAAQSAIAVISRIASGSSWWVTRFSNEGNASLDISIEISIPVVIAS